MQKQYSVLVNAPIEVVFQAITGKDELEKLMYGQLETKFKTATDFSNPVGTKFHQTIAGLIDLDGEVLAYKRPLEFGLGITVAGIKGTVFYELKELDKTLTEITFNLELFDATTPKRMLLKTLLPLFNRIIKNYLESIKQLAEDSYVH